MFYMYIKAVIIKLQLCRKEKNSHAEKLPLKCKYLQLMHSKKPQSSMISVRKIERVISSLGKKLTYSKNNLVIKTFVFN